MQSDIQTILKEFEPLDELYERMRSGGDDNFNATIFFQFQTHCFACIDRVAGKESVYAEQARELKAHTPFDDSRGQYPRLLVLLRGVILALKSDVTEGRMKSYKERIHADMFSDMLEGAGYFLQDGFKDAAAVMIGGVLEGHLKELCQKNGIDLETPDTRNPGATKPKKADTLNSELYKADVYGLTEQKQILAWLDIRNNAAHAQYEKYDQKQVELFLDGLRNFIAKFPA